jgi:hypothetical protein
MSTENEIHVVSDFRAAMARHGYVISFSQAAAILVDAGIMRDTGVGYVVAGKLKASATNDRGES